MRWRGCFVWAYTERHNDSGGVRCAGRVGSFPNGSSRSLICHRLSLRRSGRPSRETPCGRSSGSRLARTRSGVLSGDSTCHSAGGRRLSALGGRRARRHGDRCRDDASVGCHRAAGCAGRVCVFQALYSWIELVWAGQDAIDRRVSNSVGNELINRGLTASEKHSPPVPARVESPSGIDLADFPFKFQSFCAPA